MSKVLSTLKLKEVSSQLEYLKFAACICSTDFRQILRRLNAFTTGLGGADCQIYGIYRSSRRLRRKCVYHFEGKSRSIADDSRLLRA